MKNTDIKTKLAAKETLVEVLLMALRAREEYNEARELVELRRPARALRLLKQAGTRAVTAAKLAAKIMRELDDAQARVVFERAQAVLHDIDRYTEAMEEGEE